MATRNRKTEYRHYDRYKRNKEAKGFYNSKAWRTAREQRLILDNHLCQKCLRRGILTPAELVHHIIELLVDWELALDLDNLESLCNACHNEEHPEKGGGNKKEEVTKERRARVVESKANEEVF